MRVHLSNLCIILYEVAILSSHLWYLMSNNFLKKFEFGLPGLKIMTILDTNYTNSGPIVQAKRLELVRKLDEMLTRISSWGQANLVEFNVGKTQV